MTHSSERTRQDNHQTVRVLAVVLVGGVFLLLALSTAVTESVLSRVPEYAPVLRLMPRYQGQSGDPDLGRRSTIIDVDAIRRAAEFVPDEASYHVQAPEPFVEDVRRVARLYFLPALAVSRANDADWILAFRSRSLPEEVEDWDSIVLSRDVSLIRVGPH